MAETENYSIGNTIFYIFTAVLSIFGMVLLMIWGFHANNLKAGFISIIFITMIFAGFLFAILTQQFKSMNYGSFGDTSLGFLLGFIIWQIIGSSSKSVLSISSNTLFSSIASELPIHLEFIMEAVVIPFAEEMFWMIGLPVALYAVMKLVGKKFELFNNKIFQIIVIIIISGITFALFHVGQSSMGFIISAMVFRAIMIWMVLGDQQFDWLTAFTMTAGFSFGAHSGNNWAQWGFSDGLGHLIQNFDVGFVIILFYLLILLAALNQFGQYLYKWGILKE